MILLDTNIFVIDRFFPRDNRYRDNLAFIDTLGRMEAGFPLFSLLELCGIASYNLSVEELETWLSDFGSVYPVRVLDPFDLRESKAIEWLGDFASSMAYRIARKMRFGDAVILREAEGYRAEAIVTWNPKDFKGRTKIRVFTPLEIM